MGTMMGMQRGNILFLILLAIVLFAALSYAVTGGMAVKEDQRISSEKAESAVATIHNYFSLMENTVQRLRMSNGCKDNQIAFANTVVSGYNGYGGCGVFTAGEGGMAWQTPDPSWLAPATGSEDVTYGQYFIPYGVVCIQGMGTGVCSGSSAQDKDLVIGLSYVSDKVCSAYNAKLGITIPDNPSNCFPLSSGPNKFNGAYQVAGQMTCPATAGMSTACVPKGNRGNMIYYVLWAR